MTDLDRLERLRGVQVARSILEQAFSLQLTIVGPEGPLAHARCHPPSTSGCSQARASSGTEG